MAGFANLVVLDLECPTRLCRLSSTAVAGGRVSQDDYVDQRREHPHSLHPGGWLPGAGWPTSDTPKRYHLCLQALQDLDGWRQV